MLWPRAVAFRHWNDGTSKHVFLGWKLWLCKEHVFFVLKKIRSQAPKLQGLVGKLMQNRTQKSIILFSNKTSLRKGQGFCWKSTNCGCNGNKALDSSIGFAFSEGTWIQMRFVDMWYAQIQSSSSSHSQCKCCIFSGCDAPCLIFQAKPWRYFACRFHQTWGSHLVIKDGNGKPPVLTDISSTQIAVNGDSLLPA